MQFAISFWKDGGTPDRHVFPSPEVARAWAQERHQGRGVSLSYEDETGVHDWYLPFGGNEWVHDCRDHKEHSSGS